MAKQVRRARVRSGAARAPKRASIPMDRASLPVPQPKFAALGRAAPLAAAAPTLCPLPMQEGSRRVAPQAAEAQLLCPLLMQRGS